VFIINISIFLNKNQEKGPVSTEKTGLGLHIYKDQTSIKHKTSSEEPPEAMALQTHPP
jgi:hypothetical protein